MLFHILNSLHITIDCSSTSYDCKQDFDHKLTSNYSLFIFGIGSSGILSVLLSVLVGLIIAYNKSIRKSYIIKQIDFLSQTEKLSEGSKDDPFGSPRRPISSKEDSSIRLVKSGRLRKISESLVKFRRNRYRDPEQ